MSLSFFLIFAKFGPGGPKNDNFWPFFDHFRSFSDLEIFLVNEFFWFFTMMFLGMFRRDSQKNVEKGQNSALQGHKNNHFCPFFGHYQSFLDLEFFSVNEFFWFFNMMFLGIFRSDLQNLGQILKGGKNDVIFQIAQKLAWIAPCFATKCSNHL